MKILILFDKASKAVAVLGLSLAHGLQTPNEVFFIEIQNFWAWADKLGR